MNSGITVGVQKKVAEQIQNQLLGKIKLIVPVGDPIINSESTALAYVQQFTTATITETSYTDNIFYFTVPAGTSFDENDNFCSTATFTNTFRFIDVLGLVTAFGSYAFAFNTQDNVIGNASFKENAFYKCSGKNIVLDCTFTGAQAFYETTNDNYLGNCEFEKGFNFMYCTGKNTLGNCNFGTNDPQGFDFAYSLSDNTLGNCVFNGGGNFADARGNNTFGECEFLTGGNFVTTTGNNTFLKSKFIGDSQFKLSTGNNSFADGTEFQGDEIFATSTGNNTFGNNCLLTMCNYFMMDSTGVNTFGNNLNCTGAALFVGSLGVNKFGNKCIFSDYNFVGSGGKKTFGNECEFGEYCFTGSSSIGFNEFGENCTFSHYCFNNSTSNNKFIRISVGDNFLEAAAPTIKNEVGFIISSGSSLCIDYVGRFHFLENIPGNGYLPADIFTTIYSISIHYPNTWLYNNAGAKAVGLLNIEANATNPESLFTPD